MPKNERTKLIRDLSVASLTGLALYTLAFAGFSWKIRKEIKDLAEGRCEKCKKVTSRGLASHINHDRSLPGYDTAQNGHYFCHLHETEYHLTYAFEPEKIGLPTNQAISAAWSNYIDLTPEERSQIDVSLLPNLDKIRQIYFGDKCAV